VIRPALARGEWVLCDRFATATLAYQGFGHGVPLGTLQSLIATAVGTLEPDLILLVDIPVDVSRTRVAARSADSGRLADRMEREDEAFHRRVRDGYLRLARENARFRILDGLRPAETLIGEALAIVREKAAQA
jgi:dTMP kinase